MSWTTPEKLMELKQLHSQTTPAPWYADPPQERGPMGWGIFNEDGGSIFEVGDPYPRGNNKPSENTDFTVAAHEAVPPLIDEIMRLRRSL